MQGLKINECGDQIVPIPIQRNNCIESVRLRKEILVNSAKMQESVQPLDSVLDQTKKKGDYGTLPTDDEKKKLELVLMLSHQREKQKFITRSIINGIR